MVYCLWETVVSVNRTAEENKKLGLTVKIRVLPEDAERTDMGVIADTFRRRQDVVTGSAIIRTSGWGVHAREAARGGLDYAIHNGGKALLLGVDIYKLTAMHYMEDNPCVLFMCNTSLSLWVLLAFTRFGIQPREIMTLAFVAFLNRWVFTVSVR